MTDHEHEAGKTPDQDAGPRWELATQRVLRLNRRQMIERVGRLGLGSLVLAVSGGAGLLARAAFADEDCWTAAPCGEGWVVSDVDCTATQGPDQSCGHSAQGGGFWADEYCSASLTEEIFQHDIDCGQAPPGGGAVMQEDNDCGKQTNLVGHPDDDCGTVKNPESNDRWSDSACGFGMSEEELWADASCGYKVGGAMHEDGACGYTDPQSQELSVDADCGKQLGGLVDEDQSCIENQADADCGKGVTAEAASTSDNYCGTQQPGTDEYSGDVSCGTKHSDDAVWEDEACGKKEIGGGSIDMDADCGRGKSEAGAETEANQDDDCGKKIGGTDQDPRVSADSDCGKKAGSVGGNAYAYEDNDCDKKKPLPGGGYYSDQDCGKRKLAGGTYADDQGGVPNPDPTPDPPDSSAEPTTPAPDAPGA